MVRKCNLHHMDYIHVSMTRFQRGISTERPHSATILCFPTYLPTTAQTMNYAGVIFVGVLTLALYVSMRLSRSKHK